MGTEIRIHGIGDHDVASGLGKPLVLEDGGRASPSLGKANPPVTHDVLLVSWSRVTRRAARLLWYLAFPFTLINLMAAMSPATGMARKVHRVTTHTVACLVTVSTTIWLLVGAEEASTALHLDSAFGPRAPQWAYGCVAGLLVATVLWRSRHRDSRAHAVSARVHSLIVIAVATCGFVLRPAQVHVDEFGRFAPVAGWGPSDAWFRRFRDGTAGPPAAEDYGAFLDPVALAAYTFLAAMLILVVIFWVSAPSDRPLPMTASALTAMMSGLFLTLLLSTLIVRLPPLLYDWVGRHFPYSDYDPGMSILRPRWGADSYASQMIPVVCASVLVLALLVGLVAARPPLAFLRRSSDAATKLALRRERLEWVHETIVLRLSRVVHAIVLGGVIASYVVTPVVAVLLVKRLELDDDARRGAAFEGGTTVDLPFYFDAINVAAVLIGAAFFWSMRSAGSSAPIRKALGHIGDIAGFWPITVHPLGARSYRQQVCAFVKRKALPSASGPTVIVGHSQSSVIAAWVVATSGPDPSSGAKPALVTCGSPLISLYAHLFPVHFGDSFFEAVERGSSSWTNVWRPTDPIGCAFGREGLVDVELLDPPAYQPQVVFGHGNYWVDPTQLAEISSHIPS